MATAIPYAEKVPQPKTRRLTVGGVIGVLLFAVAVFAAALVVMG